MSRTFPGRDVLFEWRDITKLEDIIIFEKNFDEIYNAENVRNPKLLYFYAENQTAGYMDRYNIELNYAICYNEKKIIFFKRLHMQGKFFIEIPYECRTRYLDVIYEINSLVDEDGMVILAVNNNPYVLESYMLVETNTNTEKIGKLIQKHNLHNSTEKGLEEVIVEMGNKRWNMMNLCMGTSVDDIREIMSTLYLYAEKEELQERGFFEAFYKPKVFISYCHKEQELILEVYKRLQLAGMNCWIDMHEIDVGEIIAKKMLDGIKQCDLALLFLSQSYRESMMAKAELHNFLADIFREKKQWYLIKIDDVNVDDIQPGLGNYKYYDLSSNDNLEYLVEDIIRVFQKHLSNHGL